MQNRFTHTTARIIALRQPPQNASLLLPLFPFFCLGAGRKHRLISRVVFLLLFWAGSTAWAQPPAIAWQKSLGGSSGDYATFVQPTLDGGYIVAGWSYSRDRDVSGNHGGGDYWIVKLDGNGQLLWQKALGGSRSDEASSISPTLDGGYIVAGPSYSTDGDVSGHHGGFISDYRLVKLGPASGSTSVSSFTLINAATEQDLQPLGEGDVLDLAGLPGAGLNIRANTDPSLVDSVVLVLSGAESRRQTERIFPYALFGDSRFASGAWGNYKPWTPLDGSYTLTATPYLKGEAGTPLTIHFTITYSAAVQGFTLFNANTDQAILELKEGEVIDLVSLPPGTTLNIRANTSPTRVRSVVFALTGAQTYQWTENGSPYMLFGDLNGNLFGRTLPAGEYTLTATPYSGSGSSGAKGTSLTLHFKIIYSAALTTFTLVDATTGKDLQQLKEGEVLDLAALPKTLSIRAHTNMDTVGSVVFNLSGAQLHQQVENLLPYALFGDDTKGGFTPWTPQVGSYTLTATPYSVAKGGGAKGVPLTIQFTIVNTQQPCTTPGFEPVVAYPSLGNYHTAITNGDLNGDNIPDVAVVFDLVQEDLGVLLGKGDGSFAPIVKYHSGNEPGGASSVAIGEFNGDGKPDLVVGNYAGTVAVLPGKGDGSFGNALSFPSGGISPRSVGVGDLNGDSKLDLVVAHFGEAPDYAGTISVLLGRGDGSFAQAVPYGSSGSGAQSVAVNDLNKDGKLDAVVANYHSGTVSVLLGRGDGSFAGAVLYASGGSGGREVKTHDFNRDGTLDIAVLHTLSDALGVLLGDGKGSFAGVMAFPSGGNLASSFAMGDFNSDGKTDVAVANSFFRTTVVLQGDGKGGFTEAGRFASGSSSPQAITAGDFNRDGKADLAIAHFTINAPVGVLLNNCSVALPLVETFIRQTPFRETLTASDTKLLAFPNPFSRQTTIRFSVPGNGYVTLGLYDERGVEVRRLFQGQLEGGQEYRKELVSKDLPAGVYLLRFVTPGEVMTQKVVLLR